MDFSSQLANLQRTAASAASQQQQGGGNTDRRPDDHRGAQKRRRRGGHPHSGPHGRRHWNEHALKRALATLPHFRMPITSAPARPSSEDDSPKRRHIALLIISIDDLPHEHLWKAWAQDAEAADVQISLLCHAKFPRRIESSWLKQRLLAKPPIMGRGHEYQAPTYHSRCPEWGSIEITRGMLDLLHEGLQIGQEDGETDSRFSIRRYALDRNTPGEILSSSLLPVDKFIFVSETCIPIATLRETKKALFGEGDDEISRHQHVSWVHARNTPNNGYSKQQQFDKIHPVVPRSCFWKADQWMILSRAHAKAIMEIDTKLPRDHFLWECFEDTRASDELYFPTALGLLGVLPSSPTVQLKRVTYVDWSVSARNPVSFAKGAEDLKRVAKLGREAGCLLARKFVLTDSAMTNGTTDGNEENSPGYISVEEWRSVIHVPDDGKLDEAGVTCTSE